MAATKPRVIVLGGTGFIGRNIVKYLVEKNLVAKVRAADKVLPATAYFAQETASAFASPLCEFKQANLNNAASVAKVFADETGKYDIVINCAGATQYSQSDDVYKERILDVAKVCSEEAAKAGVTRWVEISTAQVYDSGSKPSKEDAKLKPWTGIAKFKLQAEELLKANRALSVVILRPSIVYGPGDVSGIAPRLIAAATYVGGTEKMEFLHGGDLKINTVHVYDVAKAAWHVANLGVRDEIFNLSDKQNTDQKVINEHIAKIFGIKTGFKNALVSTAAKAALRTATDIANEQHLKPWSDICKKYGILNTPLTPYIDLELMMDNHLSVDGTKIEGTGFAYDFPNVTEAELRHTIAYFAEQNLFPPVMT